VKIQQFGAAALALMLMMAGRMEGAQEKRRRPRK